MMSRIDIDRAAVPAPLAVSAGALKAIGMMCIAVTLFSCLDASAKYLASHAGLPTAEIVWLRFLGQFVFMAIILRPGAIPGLFRTKKIWHQMTRSVLMVGCTLTNFIAVQYLRLDQTVSIAFLAPLLVALLAGPVLGEWVGWKRFAAIIVGFVGILIVVRPGLANVHPAFAVSFLSVLQYAAFMLLTRYLSAYDPPLVTLFYALLAGTFGAAPIALMHWVWPATAFDWMMLLCLGAFGGAGHYLLILAYRLAPATVVTPFLYFQILSMIALGYLVFGDVPDQWTLVGVGVVIASGIYLMHRERVMARQAPLATVAAS